MIPTIKTKMYWTTSDSTQDLLNPTVPEATIGHIHLHRNSRADHVQVWQLGAGLEWIDCTSRYGKNEEPFIRHPTYPTLVITTRGKKKAPSYVSLAYFKKKKKRR
jgi:hypothetical protein